MIPLLLILATSCPPWAPTNTSTAACASLDACIARVIAEGDPDTDAVGEEREHLLVAQRLERCAWSAYTERDGARASVASLSLMTCEPCPVAPWFQTAAEYAGVCAACTGLTALGGWAACRP